MSEITVNGKPLSAKATNLIQTYMKTTGHDDANKVVEELAFTVYELLKVVLKRGKTDASVSGDKLEGIVSSFTRFDRTELEKIIGERY